MEFTGVLNLAFHVVGLARNENGDVDVAVVIGDVTGFDVGLDLAAAAVGGLHFVDQRQGDHAVGIDDVLNGFRFRNALQVDDDGVAFFQRVFSRANRFEEADLTSHLLEARRVVSAFSLRGFPFGDGLGRGLLIVAARDANGDFPRIDG